MPFTPCHAAAVLPFLRTPLVPSALVVGSMAPDAFYYVLVDVPVRTHTFAAVATVDVAIGVVLLLLWHGLLRRPAVAAAPAALRERLPAPAARASTSREWLQHNALVLVSLMMGSLTHVVWDAFTHRGRWGTELVPWLGETHGPLPGWQWASYSGTAIGTVALVLWLARWWRRTPRRTVAATRPLLDPAVAAGGWGLVLAAATVAALLAAWDQLDGGPAAPHGLGYMAATRGGAAGAVVALALAVLLTWSWRRRTPA